MNDKEKTKTQLIRELEELRKKCVELEKPDDKNHPADTLRIQRDLAVSLSSTSNLDSAMRTILTSLFQLEDLDSGAIYLVDESKGTLNLIACEGVSPEFIKSSTHIEADDPRTAMVMSGKPVYTEQSKLDGSQNIQRNIKAVAIIPVTFNNKSIACLILASHTQDLISSPVKEILETVAALSGEIIVRTQAQEELKKSEARYALAQKSAGIGSWDLNIITGGLTWSEMVKPIFDYKGDISDITHEIFLNCVHPDDRQFVIDSVQASIEKKKNYDIEHRIIRPDSSIRWVSEKGNVIYDVNGTAVRMIGIVQDITDRKKTEEELNFLKTGIDQAYDSIIITDKDGIIHYVNPSFEEVTGFSKEEVIGQNPRMLKSSEHPDIFYKKLWKTILNGDIWHDYIINRRKDGTLYHEEMTITPVKSNGEISFFVAI